MAHFHVYGIGAALVDTEIEVSDNDLTQLNIDKGLMTLVDESRQHQLVDHLEGHLVASRRACGGSAANTVIALSYFGGNGFYSCKVADDENGHFYLEDLQQAGVTHPYNGDLPSGITGKCLVMITPDAERTMNTFLGISETVSEAELDHDAIANSDYLYIEGYLATSDTGRSAAIQARQSAEKNNTKVSISLSDPGIVEHFRSELAAMMGDKQVDLLFCNEAEALHWTKADGLTSAIEKLKSVARSFAITLGNKGAVVFDGEHSHSIAPHPVTAVDTNGAGDMFAGAFLYALTQGHDHCAAGDFASQAAARVVSQFGPRLHPEQHAEMLQTLTEPPQ